MKILTVIATIFMPLTFVTGLYGMNVTLPHFGIGDDAMFWALMGIMALIVGGMLLFFHLQEWL